MADPAAAPSNGSPKIGRASCRDRGKVYEEAKKEKDVIRNYKVTGVQTCALPILKTRAAEVTAERSRQKALDAATVVMADPGDREAEKKFRQQGVETSVIRTDGRSGRRAIQWFS